MSFEILMNRTAVVETPTETKTASMGVSVSWATKHAIVKCRFWKMSGDERLLYASFRTEVTHKMVCSARFSDITERDRVVLGGVTYDIEFVDSVDDSDRAHHMEIVLREVRKVL